MIWDSSYAQIVPILLWEGFRKTLLELNHAFSKSSSEEYEKDLDSPYAQNIPIIVWKGFWISQKLLEEDEKLSKRS